MPISDPLTLTVAIVGAATGLLGAVLGVVNTWHQLSKERVRLRVVPKVAFQSGNLVVSTARSASPERLQFIRGAVQRLCVEVVNLSSFEVSISEVGFGRADRRRHAIIQAELSDGRKLPIRLKPREAIKAFAAPNAELDPEIMPQAIAYASTDCGLTVYGRSPALSEFVEQMRLGKSS